MTARIEDHALIGDCETAALVTRDGSIDWLCWPRFDSGACFATLLGTAEHGRWRIAPAGGIARTQRQYLPDTLILRTDFENDEGAVSLVDFMPIRRGRPVSELVRLVIGRRGKVHMRMDLALRFDYGRLIPWVTKTGGGCLRAVAGPHSVMLKTPAPLRGEDYTTVSEFSVGAGERVPFTLAYEASHLPPAIPGDSEGALAETERFWRDWAARCNYEGPWKDAVVRSLITIKALTYRPTGGIVAAATTSLPEQLGGVRNWDYRFCWLRDATFTVLSLMNAGYRDEAQAWCDWLLRAVAGAASQIQPLYGVAGEHRNDESELPWLPGYRGSRPVRIGNGAHSQLQIDIFGNVMDALFEARCLGLELHEAATGLQTELLQRLEQVWREPDEGIWEIRGERRHFVHSKLMAWVAFDRAVASAERFGLAGPVERWKTQRSSLHAEILEKGFDKQKGAFVQAYGSKELDSATLLMPIFGFLPPDDPRIVSTVRAIETDLCRDGLLLRYDTRGGGDGLPAGEGAFLACSFWLADNLILQGRRDEAERLFERLLSLRNDVGLLAEQYDTQAKAFAGNYPQAFSHFALVDTAFNFSQSRGAVREARWK